MKRFFILLFMFCASLFLFLTVSAGAAGEESLFLLGQNEKAEVILPSGTISLELGKNPIQVLTGSKGQKLILCGGQEEKPGEVKQGASLRLLASDLKSYEKTLECDSALIGYEVNSDTSTIWLSTRGGVQNKEPIKAKIYQISLDPFTVKEYALDSLPCQIALSGDGKWLAVASLGDMEKPTSVLTVFDADSMQPAASFDITKNPGMLQFSDDNLALVVAGYGYQVTKSTGTNSESVSFTIPTPYFMKLKESTPAGATIVDLTTLQCKSIELGAVNRELVVGGNATVYSIVKEASAGTVKAVGPQGALWEKKYDYVPKYIQERPDAGQVFIIGGKRAVIVDKPSGNLVKDITAENELQPFVFLENLSYAYAYSMGSLRLNILDLSSLELEKPQKVGSAGLAVLKTTVAIASMAEYGNNLQPHYVGGVQIPTRTSSIYWTHAPKGNMVAAPEQQKLFMLNSFLAEIYTYDFQKGVVSKKLGYLGEKTLYLQLAPNGKYVILVSGDNWKLVNIQTDKADLTFNPIGLKFGFAFAEPTAPTPYFSQDGNRMYIPNGSKITVIDLQNAKKLAAIDSQTKDALIFW